MPRRKRRSPAQYERHELSEAARECINEVFAPDDPARSVDTEAIVRECEVILGSWEGVLNAEDEVYGANIEDLSPARINESRNARRSRARGVIVEKLRRVFEKNYVAIASQEDFKVDSGRLSRANSDEREFILRMVDSKREALERSLKGLKRKPRTIGRDRNIERLELSLKEITIPKNLAKVLPPRLSQDPQKYRESRLAPLLKGRERERKQLDSDDANNDD